MRRRCVWCRQTLLFQPGRGWVHEATGETYATRQEVEHRCRNPRCVKPEHLGLVTKDDHCALPDMSDSGAVREGAAS